MMCLGAGILFLFYSVCLGELRASFAPNFYVRFLPGLRSVNVNHRIRRHIISIRWYSVVNVIRLKTLEPWQAVMYYRLLRRS